MINIVGVANLLAEKVDGLNTSLSDPETGLIKKVDDLAAYGKRNRHLIRLLVASVIFDVVLSVSTGVVAWVAISANSTASQNHRATVVTCQVANTARTQNQQLWDFILGISTPPNPTPQQTEALNKIRTKVSETFALRDCQALAKGQLREP